MIKSLFVAFLALACVSADAQNKFSIENATGGSTPSFIRPAPTYVNARSLAASVSETDSVPSGAQWVLFGATCDFYAKTGASAAVPGDTTDGTAAELNPAAWRVTGITQISVIASATCVVTLTYYL